MASSIFLLFLSFLLSLVYAQSEDCASYLTLHEIMALESRTMTIDDEAGLRSLKATKYEIGNCRDSRNYPTGAHFAANHSLLGLESTLGSNNCVTREIAGKQVMESMVAVVIQTNGWPLEVTRLDIDDIDTQQDVPFDEAWIENAAAFGMSEGNLVLPVTKLGVDTLLSSKEYLVPKSAMDAMGLGLDEAFVPGAEYSSDTLFNCPFGKDLPDSAKCRLTISFESPIDTLVLLYGLKQQSYTATESALFLSQMDLKCGCRCVHGSAGSREVALPTENEGLCKKVVTSADRTECDVLGEWWCAMEKSFAYKISGEESGGVHPCVREPAYAAKVLCKFSPSENFSPIL